MTKIFNSEKTLDQYQNNATLFFGDEMGLFDTVNKPFPKIWAIYKQMKSLDWSEEEFDFLQCNLDFKNCPKSVRDMMIRTLAWQWEADSVASTAILPLMAPFVSDTSLWSCWQRISDNESIHAATYSEIVRMSFDNPENVLQEILAVKESFKRLHTVQKIFDELYEVSHKYALGKASVKDAYDKLFMAIVAILLLERIQFIASFAITFTICGTNLFQSIGKAVQKIAQDELEVHVEFDKEILRIELATERGKSAYTRLKPEIEKLFNEVVQTELDWADDLFSEGRELIGANVNTIKQWVLFNAKDPANFLDLETHFKFPKTNPMSHLENWLNIASTQVAPQEQDSVQYKVNMVVRDDTNASFDIDF
jgi:ribonucleoside-diphosphate reductase beta chain